MSRGRFALGLMWGFSLGMAANGLLAYLDAIAQQYVRAPGSPVAVRMKERKPA